MVTRPRLWLKTTSEKGPHLSCVVFTDGSVSHVGRNFATMAPANSSSGGISALVTMGRATKEEGKMALFQRQKVQALEVMRVMRLRVQRNYLPEEKY